MLGKLYKNFDYDANKHDSSFSDYNEDEFNNVNETKAFSIMKLQEDSPQKSRQSWVEFNNQMF